MLKGNKSSFIHIESRTLKGFLTGSILSYFIVFSAISFNDEFLLNSTDYLSS